MNQAVDAAPGSTRPKSIVVETVDDPEDGDSERLFPPDGDAASDSGSRIATEAQTLSSAGDSELANIS